MTPQPPTPTPTWFNDYPPVTSQAPTVPSGMNLVGDRDYTAIVESVEYGHQVNLPYASTSGTYTVICIKVNEVGGVLTADYTQSTAVQGTWQQLVSQQSIAFGSDVFSVSAGNEGLYVMLAPPVINACIVIAVDGVLIARVAISPTSSNFNQILSDICIPVAQGRVSGDVVTPSHLVVTQETFTCEVGSLFDGNLICFNYDPALSSMEGNFQYGEYGVVFEYGAGADHPYMIDRFLGTLPQA